MRFLALVLVILALAAALMFAGSFQRGDVLGQWLFGFLVVLLGLGAGLVWGEDDDR